MEPVYETDKVLKEEIEQLCCRATHCVRLKVTTHAENNNLYNIFALYAGQDCKFMRRWLKFFMMTVYPRNFEAASHHCLMPKGLTLDIWAGGIEDGRKGDFLALYSLNLMLDTHTVVHLKNGRLWTTIKNRLLSHDELVKMCNFHLVYLGRGLFVELMERKRPLTIVEENDDTKTVIIGELTFDEQDTLDKVIYCGLGFGVDRSREQIRSLPHTAGHEINREITIKKEREANTAQIDYEKLEHEFNLKKLSIRCNRAEVTQYLESKHQLVQGESTTDKRCEKTIRVHVHKLNLRTLTSIKLSREMLQKLHAPVDYDSDKIEDYWPLDHEHSTVFEPILVSEPKKAVKTLKRRIRSKPSKGGFNISVHGVKKHKRRTYLSCKVAGCKTKFDSVKAWNARHRRLH